MYRGQAYDGASVMQGKRNGVATRIRQDVLQALPVHCLAHSLNLRLQEDRFLCSEMPWIPFMTSLSSLIIHLSAKLLSEKLHDHSGSCIGLKPLCPTRWTVRAEAIDVVIKQYTIIIETLDEVNKGRVRAEGWWNCNSAGNV